MTAPIVPVFKVETASITQALAALTEVGRMALAVALNRSGEVGMAQQRPKVEAAFHVRNPRFDVPPVSIPPAFRATADNLTARVALFYGDDDASSIGSRAEKVFGKFGQAQEITANTPLMPFFQPTPALRKSPMQVIPKSVYPSQLTGIFDTYGNFKGLGRKGRVRYKFKRLKNSADIDVRQVTRVNINGQNVSVFMLGQPGERSFGIYERFGKGYDGVKMVWWFRETEPVAKLLDFQADIERVFAEQWPQQAADALQAAMDGKLPGAMRRG